MKCLKNLVKKNFVLMIVIQFTLSPFAFAQQQQGLLPGLLQVATMGAQQYANSLSNSNMCVDQRISAHLDITTQAYPPEEFGACTNPPAVSNKLSEYCVADPSLRGEADFNRAYCETEQFLSIAENNVQQYQNFLAEGQSSTHNASIVCMKDEQKKAEEELEKYEGQIRDLMARYREQFETMKRQIEEEKNLLQNLAFELDGGSGRARAPGTNDAQEFRFENYFQSPACQQTITEANARIGGQQRGLRGLREGLSATNTRAEEALNFNFEDALTGELNQIRTNFKRGGLTSVLDYNDATAGSSSIYNLPVIKAAYEDYILNIDPTREESERILRQLSNDNLFRTDTIVVSTPAFDQNFLTRAGQILQNSESGVNSWRNDYLEQCVAGEVTGSASQGWLDYISGNLRQNRRRTAAAKHFEGQISAILASNYSIQTKMDLIAKAQNSLGVVDPVVVIHPTDRGSVMSPHAFLQNQVTQCETQYASNKVVLDPNGTGRITYAEAHNQLRTAIADVQGIYSNFLSEVSEATSNRFLNCEGVSYRSNPATENDPGACGPTKLDRSSASFCKSQSVACASNINQCYTELQNTIASKELERNQRAETLNTVMRNLNSQLKRNIEQIAAALQQHHEILKQSYPTIENLDFNNKDAPNLMTMPELTDQMVQELGVSLVAEGDPEKIWQEFQNRIDQNIIPQLENRRNKLIGRFSERIAAKQRNYETEIGYWEQVADDCRQVIAQVDDLHEQRQQEIMEYNQELMSAYNNLCQRDYQFNAQNCNEEAVNTLGQTFDQIAGLVAADGGQISENDQNAYRRFRAGCAVVNQRYDTDEEPSNRMDNQINGFCVSIKTEDQGDHPEFRNWHEFPDSAVYGSPFPYHAIDNNLVGRLTELSRIDIGSNYSAYERFQSEANNIIEEFGGSPLISSAIRQIETANRNRSSIESSCSSILTDNSENSPNGVNTNYQYCIDNGGENCDRVLRRGRNEDNPREYAVSGVNTNAIQSLLNRRDQVEIAQATSGYGEGGSLPMCTSIQQQLQRLQMLGGMGQRMPAGGFDRFGTGF